MENLEVSPAELKAKAQKIKDSAQIIANVIDQKMINHLDDMADNGNQIWCGVASKKFEQKYRKKCENLLEKVVTQISAQAENVMTVADNYAKSEGDNEKIASTLSTDLNGVF